MWKLTADRPAGGRASAPRSALPVLSGPLRAAWERGGTAATLRPSRTEPEALSGLPTAPPDPVSERLEMEAGLPVLALLLTAPGPAGKDVPSFRKNPKLWRAAGCGQSSEGPCSRLRDRQGRCCASSWGCGASSQPSCPPSEGPGKPLPSAWPGPLAAPWLP